MNSFEKHIQDHKEELEINEVNPEIWLFMENELLRQKNRKSRLYIRWMTAVAAVLVGIMALGAGYFWNTQSIDQQLLVQYGLERQQFPQQIQIKKQQLAKAQIPLYRKKDFDLLLTQLEFLDAQYQDYLQYVKEHGYQDFIGQQILHYYKTKIELLDKIQYEIKKIDNYDHSYSKSPKVELNI